VIYSDTASGKSMAGRPQLARALDDLDGGVELVIAEWDRATRSMWDGLQIIKAVIDAGAAIRVLDRSYIDLATPMGRGFMAMMSAMGSSDMFGSLFLITDFIKNKLWACPTRRSSPSYRRQSSRPSGC